VNNPTLTEFCFGMIGRADIEGSKSNVAMNAWLPQASYPCYAPPGVAPEGSIISQVTKSPVTGPHLTCGPDGFLGSRPAAGRPGRTHPRSPRNSEAWPLGTPRATPKSRTTANNGNFSGTSSLKFRGTKGSIGHTFMVCIHTENQNQGGFYPFILLKISVLYEPPLGHLRYGLTDVPPQPNSPPDNVFNPDRPARDLNARSWAVKPSSASLNK